jgi:hypothetical protein
VIGLANDGLPVAGRMKNANSILGSAEPALGTLRERAFIVSRLPRQRIEPMASGIFTRYDELS